MSEKLSKKLSKLVPDLRWPIGRRPAQKSFSVPKNLFKKCSAMQKVEDEVNQNDSETSYETVLATTDSVTSLEYDLSSGWDSEESISDEKDYSSIEVPRSACTLYHNISFDVLANIKSVVANDFSSDPCEFFHQNQPLALSTPVKHSDLAISSNVFSIEDPDLPFKFNKPVACSTPIKQSTSPILYHFCEDDFTPCAKISATSTPKTNQRRFFINYDEQENFKSFLDLTDEEETIIEKPVISFISSSGLKNQSAANPDVEDVNGISMLLHIPYQEDPDIFELDEVRMTINENKPINKKESSNENSTFKALDTGSAMQKTNIRKNDLIHKCNSDSKVRKKEHALTVKRREDIPVCCLTVPPKDPIPKRVKIGVKDCVPDMRALKNEHLHKKGLENVSMCCLGALECVLPTLNMAVPTVSVKNALRAGNRKAKAPGQ